jgi:hypothetical protein
MSSFGSFARLGRLLPPAFAPESAFHPNDVPKKGLRMTDSDTGRDADDASKNGNGAKTILAQARKDWDAAELRERHNIRLAYEDLEFLAGDELSQWPEKQRRERENDGRPTLQINQLPQVVHQIRRHPPASPVDQGHSGRQRRRRADRGPARRPDPLHREPLRRERHLPSRRRQPGRLRHLALASRDRIRRQLDLQPGDPHRADRDAILPMREDARTIASCRST